jgi:thiol-disulfide isomerase/thioredoxin
MLIDPIEMIEIAPITIQFHNNAWRLLHPTSHSGGAMLAITTNWCPHCVALKNSIVPAAQQLTQFNFFWMDGDKTDAARQKSRQLDVKGFPTLFYVDKGGYLRRYDGDRSTSQLAQTFHR